MNSCLLLQEVGCDVRCGCCCGSSDKGRAGDSARSKFLALGAPADGAIRDQEAICRVGGFSLIAFLFSLRLGRMRLFAENGRGLLLDCHVTTRTKGLVDNMGGFWQTLAFEETAGRRATAATPLSPRRKADRGRFVVRSG